MKAPSTASLMPASRRGPSTRLGTVSGSESAVPAEPSNAFFRYRRLVNSRPRRLHKLFRGRLPVFRQVVPPPRNTLLLQPAKKGIERLDDAVVEPARANPSVEFTLDLRHHPIERSSLSLHERLPLLLQPAERCLRAGESLPRLVEVCLIARKQGGLPIELLDLSELGRVETPFGERLFHLDPKSLLIPRKRLQDSGHVRRSRPTSPARRPGFVHRAVSIGAPDRAGEARSPRIREPPRAPPPASGPRMQ